MTNDKLPGKNIVFSITSKAPIAKKYIFTNNMSQIKTYT